MVNLDKESDETPKFNLIEQKKIDEKIKLETIVFFRTMAKVSAFTNSFGAFFYCLIIYPTTSLWLLVLWYTLLVSTNLANILWWRRFKQNHISPQETQKCRQGFLYIIMIICLIWGSIGILFMDNDSQQLTTIIFLSAVLICFTFATALDLTIGCFSIICLLAPTVFYHAIAYSSFHNNLHLAVITAFIVLGLFMLAACFLGNAIIIKLFRLSYENALLSQKLADINITLEEKVKKRTEELETSLKIVHYQATHDLLTKLPNERLLHEYFNTISERAIKNHHKFIIASFSLNGMSKINDSLGHQAATTIITRIAQRLSSLFKKSKLYFVTLLRQDAFVVLIEPQLPQFEIEPFVKELFHVLDNPVYAAQQSLQLTGSIGVSVYPDNGLNIDMLITNAETARALATVRGGNNICIYSTSINANASKQLNIENLLYQAVKNNELVLHYQPFIDLNTGVICGAEALIRWNNPELGLVPPLDFIPLAEANGMIIPIGEWVLRTACQQLKKWQQMGCASFIIAINLSAKQLLNPNLIDYIKKTLNDLDLKSHSLELELTESNAFQNDAIPVIHKLTDMGISLAIDDFGTGYSELSNLKLFNINKIKIDRTFIHDIQRSIDSRNIVLHTIALAQHMGIECLAEGVETIEQVNFLKENGCHIVQGYYFSRPLNEEQFLDFIKK